MDESFWVAIGFFVFLYFAYRPIRKAIVNSLDARINEIKENLAETERLKAEAKSLLDEVQKEMDNFQKYREQVLDNAKISTERLVETRSKEMDLFLARKSESAIGVIEHEKTKILDQLKNEFTDQVISIVRTYMVKSKNNDVSDKEIISKFISSGQKK